jgi:hypothetical protein
VFALIFRIPLLLGILHQLVAVGLFAVSIKMLFHLKQCSNKFIGASGEDQINKLLLYIPVFCEF